MTSNDRKRIFEALMCGVHEYDYPQLGEFCAAELQRLTPIIEDIEEQAELRGRIQALLELWAKQEERRFPPG